MSANGRYDGKDLVDILDRIYNIDHNVTNFEIRKRSAERKENGIIEHEARISEREGSKKFPKSIVGDGKIPKYLTVIESYEERKKKAMIDGTEVEYIGCPMCGKTTPLKGSKKNGINRGIFGQLDEENNIFVPYTDRILQVRKGGGGKRGFFKVDDRDISLEVLIEANPHLFYNIKSIVKKLSDEIERIEKI